MRIPKKITPNNLKETLVQIQFEPNCPPELVLGKFNTIFEKELKYISPDFNDPSLKNRILPDNSGYFIDLEKDIKINISGNSITFNSFESYIGWTDYSSWIKNILQKLKEFDLIRVVKRIGIRYISQYDNNAILDKVALKISFDKNSNLNSTQFKTEYKEDNFKIILTLVNNLPTHKQDLMSIIDIDVIKTYNLNFDAEKILFEIDEAHTKQKEVFFGLLSDKFLQSLNPEY